MILRCSALNSTIVVSERSGDAPRREVFLKPPRPHEGLPGNSAIVLSEAVLVRVIVIEVLDITRSRTITSTRTSTMN